MTDHASHGSQRPLLTAIAVMLIVYVISAIWGGWPQYGAKLVGDAEHGEMHEVAHEVPGEDFGAEAARTPPPYWMVAPFVLLLGAIAVLPLIPATEHWWDSNRNRFLVAAGLGLATLAYYVFLHRHTIDGHWPVHHLVPSSEGLNWGLALTVLANAMLNEYIPFIILLFSLYTIAGGIRITGDMKAHPLTNTAILGLGAVLANFVGTTGASVLPSSHPSVVAWMRRIADDPPPRTISPALSNQRELLRPLIFSLMSEHRSRDTLAHQLRTTLGKPKHSSSIVFT